MHSLKSRVQQLQKVNKAYARLLEENGFLLTGLEAAKYEDFAFRIDMMVN